MFLTFAKVSQEIRQTDRKLRKKIAGSPKKFGSIRNHLKSLTFSVILLGNRIISGEFAANIIFLHSQGYFFGVRIRLGTILGRFSIIYFRGFGLRISVRFWVRVWVRVRVSVVLRSG